MTLMTSCRQNNYTGHKDDDNLQAHILVRTVVDDEGEAYISVRMVHNTECTLLK